MTKTELNAANAAAETGIPAIAPDAAKTYTIEVGDEEREMTIEELLDFAQQCANRIESENADLPDLQAFIKQYPGVTDIPDEVAQAMRGGKGILEAYREYENANLKNELSAIKKNESNRQKAIGSVRSDGGGDAELDELMRVFESVFK